MGHALGEARLGAIKAKTAREYLEVGGTEGGAWGLTEALGGGQVWWSQWMWWTTLMAPKLSSMCPAGKGLTVSQCCTGTRRCPEGKGALPGVGQEECRSVWRPLTAQPDSPFKVKVLPTHDASKVKASGPGLNTSGVPASLPVEFTIDAKDAGEGLLAVQITVRASPGLCFSLS